jgi:hypothetical protein
VKSEFESFPFPLDYKRLNRYSFLQQTVKGRTFGSYIPPILCSTTSSSWSETQDAITIFSFLRHSSFRIQLFTSFKVYLSTLLLNPAYSIFHILIRTTSSSSKARILKKPLILPSQELSPDTRGYGNRNFLWSFQKKPYLTFFSVFKFTFFLLLPSIPSGDAV